MSSTLEEIVIAHHIESAIAANKTMRNDPSRNVVTELKRALNADCEKMEARKYVNVQ